jgi:hypothetical protein
MVSESDGVSLTLAHRCGKTRHGGGTSSRGPRAVVLAALSQTNAAHVTTSDVGRGRTGETDAHSNLRKAKDYLYAYTRSLGVRDWD